MGNILTKNNTDQLAKWYGEGPHYIVSQTLLGGGAATSLSLPPVQSAVANKPPCCVEIVSAAYNAATGTYLLTFADSNYAVAGWSVSIDDVNGSTPRDGYLGQWANLGADNPAATTLSPTTCILTTYTASGSASDIALNTPVRIMVIFKKDNTGAAA